MSSATVSTTLRIPKVFGQWVPDSQASNRKRSTAVCSEPVSWYRLSWWLLAKCRCWWLSSCSESDHLITICCHAFAAADDDMVMMLLLLMMMMTPDDDECFFILLLKQSNTFDWSAETRSLILSSFYYGYVISQVPGGLLCSFWKPQHVFGLTISLSGLLYLLLPFVAHWHVNLLITCQFLMGFIQVWWSA